MQCQIADPLPNVSQPGEQGGLLSGSDTWKVCARCPVVTGSNTHSVLVLLNVCVAIIVVQQLRKLTVCLFTQLYKCRNIILPGVRRTQIAMYLPLHCFRMHHFLTEMS
jgi:hypothetical protein